ncbi:MAG: acyl carrier protein [Chrysiogenales bacterium]|nr:acyl carrier protein [Candidatus Aminicenantes bacterium]TFG79551.1 MAG: acyl carrier protein [Chrysiogenales bacterium]
MTRKEIIPQIEILVEADAGALSEQTLLSEITHWDSLAAVGFIAMVDENFGFTPSPKRIAESKTVGDLVDLVIANLKGQ